MMRNYYSVLLLKQNEDTHIPKCLLSDIENPFLFHNITHFCNHEANVSKM